jgi:DNA repair protein RecO (recombination protein O)
MRQVIKGFYLGHTNFSDTSVILRLFTENCGRRSFLVKGAKSKKGQSAILQPFNQIELVTNFQIEKELNVGNTLQLVKPLSTIATDIRKATVAIFLTEILSKSINSETDESELFEFLDHSIDFFDQSSFDPNFHLLFLSELSKYLGFYPKLLGKSGEIYFNLREGVFDASSTHLYHLDIETSNAFKKLLFNNFSTLNEINLLPNTRRNLLKALVLFYEVHLENVSIQSLEVLETVFE